MRGIIYISNAIRSFTGEDIDELVAKAADRNAELGINGYLCYEDSETIEDVANRPQSGAGNFCSTSKASGMPSPN